MKIQSKFSCFFLIIFLLYLTSCGCKIKPPIDQGIIHYKMDYQNIPDNNLILEVLPKDMKLYFTKNKTKSIIEDDLGLFRLEQLSNHKAKKYSTLFKFCEKKYVSKGDSPDDTYKELEYMHNLKIETTEKEETFKGYNCKYAKINFPDSEETYDIIFTEDIKSYKPNAGTPYNEINGVLLEFYIIIDKYVIHLKADKFENKKIDTKIFDIPEEYKTLTNQEMKKAISKLFKKLE